MLTKKLFQFKNIKTTDSKTITLLQFTLVLLITYQLINYSIILFTESTAANTDIFIINRSYAKNGNREIHCSSTVKGIQKYRLTSS